jgi:Zn-dependent metalloprotease
MSCHCTIIPKSVLDRFANDASLSDATRKCFADAADYDSEWRKARTANGKAAAAANSMLQSDAMGVTPPLILVNNCNHVAALPGNPVANPGASADLTIKRAHDETKKVAEFYQTVFGRNSVDNNGKNLLSSVHYGVNFNNAFWNGNQMTYGDGDGNIFVDFTKSNDVIGHELTHGVTQFTTQFAYQNQSGGLNESMSDVFGSMFRQWRAGHTVAQADWLIGKGIMGPAAIAQGFTCLRDMANPAAAHCLAPQPTHFSQYHDGMDPHSSSGIPNLAFTKAAKAYGGKSWEKVGKVWYYVMTKYAPQPNMKMNTFAKRTRIQALLRFPLDIALHKAIDSGWKAVGL